MLQLERQDIPDSASVLFEQNDKLRLYINNLNLIVQWYNKVRKRRRFMMCTKVSYLIGLCYEAKSFGPGLVGPRNTGVVFENALPSDMEYRAY